MLPHTTWYLSQGKDAVEQRHLAQAEWIGTSEISTEPDK